MGKTGGSGPGAKPGQAFRMSVWVAWGTHALHFTHGEKGEALTEGKGSRGRRQEEDCRGDQMGRVGPCSAVPR